MPYVGLERLLDKTDNSIYKLVILASKRALEIAEGQPKLVAVNSTTKPSTVALHEIAEGKVKYKRMKPKENN
jgi:DNA-directed RNA polymerase omega subunit